MKYIKILVLCFAVILSLVAVAGAQVVAPTGVTTRPSSQLVFFYDFSSAGIQTAPYQRETAIQVTNMSVDTPVDIHVQIFASRCADFDTFECLNPVFCEESDFNDFLTPNDTHVYFFNDEVALERNDPLNPGDISIDLEDTKGFVVITPVNNPGQRQAIAFQHLFGVSTVSDGGFPGHNYRVNAMGRDAVSFTTGNVAPNGTVLDGTANGYVLLQPEILKFNFFVNGDTGADVVSIAFRDNYSDVFGSYAAEPGDAVWTPLIFDFLENPISCDPIPQNCFFDIGINEQIFQNNTLLGLQVLCPGNDFFLGWSKIAVSGLEGLENELGLIGLVFFSLPGGGDASWMHAEGPRTAVEPPTEGACDDGVDGDGDGDIDCDDSECAGDPACVEGDCGDGVDGDEDGDTDCEDADCAASSDCAEGGAGSCTDGVDNDEDGDTDCADADCAADPACFEGSCTDGVDGDGNGLTDCADPDCAEDLACVDGGGGGGCAIASTATAGSAAANALVVLIPLLGIGLRSMLRRRKED